MKGKRRERENAGPREGSPQKPGESTSMEIQIQIQRKIGQERKIEMQIQIQMHMTIHANNNVSTKNTSINSKSQ